MVTVHLTMVTTMEIVHFTMVTHNGNCTLHNGYTQWELYTSQWFPDNGDCPLHNNYYNIVTVHFTMVTTKWELYTSQCLPHN